MKLPLLLAVLALTAPAKASDLPDWDPQPTGIWNQYYFTDANGVTRALWCNPAQCGQGATAPAPLYELTEVSRQAFTVNNGAVLPWNRESWTAYRTTYSSKVSHWRLDPRTREAVQGDQRARARNQAQMTATGSVWIVHPPTARLADQFARRQSPPPGRRNPPPGRQNPPPAQQPGNARNGRILEFTLYGETGQLVDGRPYEEKESDWLSVAEHRAFLSACPQRQGQAPVDSPACRQAVTTARGQIAQNMRDTVWLNGKTYRQRYQEIVTNLPPDGAARDNRVTDLLVLLQALKDKKYGQPPDSQHEVQLRAEERARLGAAPAGAQTAGKTGAALLQEYDAARAALEARDHVGYWQLTNRYRREVPPAAGPGGPSQPGTALNPLTDAERRRLEDGGQGALVRDYDAAVAARNEARQRELLDQARRWLSEHPTAQEFAAITDEAAKRRICDKMNMERNAAAGSTGQAAADDGDPSRGAMSQAEARRDEATGQARTTEPGGSRVMEGQRPPAPANTNAGYRWPQEIIAYCAQLASQQPGRTEPPRTEPPPPAQPGGANMTVGAPLGKPIAEPGKGKEPLVAWNPLLNAAKGGLAGAIVGFALGGPLGMLIGALVFGGAAWGLTKIDNA